MTITEQLAAALRNLMRAYCDPEIGFAAAVRAHSNTAYPWEPGDIAEADAIIALAAFDKQTVADDATVERVARAINTARYGGPDDKHAPPAFEDEDLLSKLYAYRLARAALAVMAAPAADDWQDIATAPRDGRPLLLYRAWEDKTMDAGYPGTIWHSAGWGKSAFPGDTFRGEASYGKPTHWRPMPPAPATQAKGSGQ